MMVEPSSIPRHRPMASRGLEVTRSTEESAMARKRFLALPEETAALL
jgi:hypothetical protein